MALIPEEKCDNISGRSFECRAIRFDEGDIAEVARQLVIALRDELNGKNGDTAIVAAVDACSNKKGVKDD